MPARAVRYARDPRVAQGMRRIRLERGWTLDVVARMFECHPSKISRIENGKRRTPRPALAAEILGVTVGYLLMPCPQCAGTPRPGYQCQRCGTRGCTCQPCVTQPPHTPKQGEGADARTYGQSPTRDGGPPNVTRAEAARHHAQHPEQL